MTDVAGAVVPAITLTDPNNRDAAPQSPIKGGAAAAVIGAGAAPDLDGIARGSTSASAASASGSSGRPGTPSSSARERRRPESPGGWTSPGRLIRTLSNNASATSINAQVHTGKDGARSRADSRSPAPAIDPLSEHILRRTNQRANVSMAMPLPTDRERSRSGDRGTTAAHEHEAGLVDQDVAAISSMTVRRTDTIESTVSVAQASKEPRKGVKAVSFISRLMGNNKKKDEEDVAEDESVSNEGRPEGNDATVFAQTIDNIGFSPRQPQPPAHIKVRSKYRKEREFDRLFLAQELSCRKRRKVERSNSSNKLRRKSSAQNGESSTVWAMDFSKDGKYLAAAGVDGVVRVWAVLSSSEDRQKHERQESTASEAIGRDAHAEHLNAPVFQSEPVREYEGHTSTVLDLSWSKNNFLLSSSMDKTVRLWHISRSECLCTFKHNDFVPSISFHPKDDRFFLAGSLDARLRLWSIPDKSVAYTARLPDMITAVAFTPDGKHAMAGCLSGLCMFYETEGLKYQSQVHVRSNRGQNAKGSKITGIHTHLDRRGDVKLLITSNDSRIRLYNFRDKSVELKFKGCENNCSQIRARISDCGRYVVCGSEDRKAYIWSMGPAEANEKPDRRPVEMFEAHNTITTAVAFAPTKTKHLLSRSEDPVYDLCNPPPVTLMESQPSSRPQSVHGSIHATPVEFEKPREPAGYITRSAHRNGNIIVTADFTGQIKIFRQDCAWSKRRGDEGDRSSLFGKRSGRVSRNGSVATRSSQPSLKEGRQSASLPSDTHILSWRQGIVHSPNANGGQRRESKNNSRSISPTKSTEQLVQGSPKQPPMSTALQFRHTPSSTPPPPTVKLSEWEQASNRLKTTHPTSADVLAETAAARRSADPDATHARSSSSAGSPGSTRSGGKVIDSNPLMIEGGRSYVFWDTQGWIARAERSHRMHSDAVPPDGALNADDGNGALDPAHLAVQRPGLERGHTAVSELSDERESMSEGRESFEEAREAWSPDRQ